MSVAHYKNVKIGKIGEEMMLKHFTGSEFSPDGFSDFYNDEGRRFEVKTCRKRTGKNGCRYGQIRITRSNHESLEPRDIYIIRVYETDPHHAEIILMITKKIMDRIMQKYNSKTVHIPWRRILNELQQKRRMYKLQRIKPVATQALPKVCL